MRTKEQRRGRPKKSSGSVKSVGLFIRLEPREKEAFSDAAGLAGVPLAVWIRERLRKVTRDELEAAAKPVAFLREDQGRISHN